MNQRYAPVLIILLVVGSLALMVMAGGMLGSVLRQQQPGEPENSVAIVDAADSSDQSGSVDIDPPEALPDFTLMDTQGNPVRLSDYRGRLVVMYFGYTYCPDFCPATLIDYREIKRDLGELAEEVVFVMVSVDPERDTPELLARYMARFDPDFVGLTGTPEAIRAAADAFNVYYEIEPHEPGAYYSVGHTASKFLVDREGRLTTVFSFGTRTETVIENIREKS